MTAHNVIAPAFAAAARSHVGCFRTLNEDRVLARSDAGLWAVADGMGGHSAGDVAAERLIAAFDVLADAHPGAVTGAAVEQVLQQVNGELRAIAAGLPGGGPIGTTAVVLAAGRAGMTCHWVGDSRAYSVIGDRLTPITRDHSFVQELVDAGILAPDQARLHPRANVITRAVGAATLLKCDRADVEAYASGRFLLCSDGLTGALREQEIAAICTDEPLDRAADRLLERALEEGARDNVSFVLLGDIEASPVSTS